LAQENAIFKILHDEPHKCEILGPFAANKGEIEFIEPQPFLQLKGRLARAENYEVKHQLEI
jgi:hypothetical protein